MYGYQLWSEIRQKGSENRKFEPGFAVSMVDWWLAGGFFLL